MPNKYCQKVANKLSENEIRDYLSSHLDILAPNLEMVGKPEHHLKNPNGSDGFVDLLTRNRLNKIYVPVELKKSRQTARQAIHEVFKYVALLQEQYKLQLHEIAPIIAAVDWQDLLTPFSEFKRAVPYDVRGLKLLLDENGVPTATEEVKSLPEREGLVICPEHEILFFSNERDRDAALTDLIRLASESRIEDYVVLRMNYSGSNEAVIFPFALYFVMAGLLLNRKLSLRQELEQKSEWDDEFDEFEWWFEEYLQDLLSQQILDLPYEIDVEISDPFKLSQMFSRWEIKEIHRGGAALSNKDIRSDQDILYALTGFADENQFYFAASSNPSFDTHWRKFRQELNRSIDSNEQIYDILNRFLDDLGPNLNRDVVALVVFRNSIVMDVCATQRETSTRLPFMIEIRIHPSSTEPPRTLLATVCWDGVTYPENPAKKFNELYGDVFTMICAKQMRDPEHEQELLSWMGLSYQLFEVVYQLGQLPKLFQLELGETGLKRIPAQTMTLQPYTSFVAENGEFLDELVDQIMEHYVGNHERSNPPDDQVIGTNEFVIGFIDITDALVSKYGSFLRPEIVWVRIAKSIRYVWLEVCTGSDSQASSMENVSRMDLGFIMHEQTSLFNPFKNFESHAENFLQLDAFSIVMTTDLFHETACHEISDACHSEDDIERI